ncbi:MAG: arsenite methyltransferase [Candidatus Hodarchaeales archaeon]|jgi:SAM-dependent methyltransferase
MTTEKSKQDYSCCGPSSSDPSPAGEEQNQASCCPPSATELSNSPEEKEWNSTDGGIRQAVRESYGKVAERSNSGSSSCCGPSSSGQSASELMGYSKEELEALPEGADLGLGCGNPTAFASIQPGDVVVDLGSGAGIDCFLAAVKAGETGKVIGIDMTPPMIDKARANAKQGGYDNVEFRLGEIEHMPVADDVADLIISNCVINLSPDKPQVFREAYRVLKPGGKMMVSDIVLLRPLPESVRNSPEAYAGCVAGAMMKEEYLGAIRSAGFENVEIVDQAGDPVSLEDDPIVSEFAENADPSQKALLSQIVMKSVVTIKVSATKPAS